MIATTYYRSLLSPSEQSAYKDIVIGLIDRKDRIYIQNTDTKSVHRIIYAVHFDHPELFYVDFWRCRVTRAQLTNGLFLQFQMMLDRESATAVMNSLKAKVDSVKKRVENASSREESYFTIAKEIAMTTKYVNSNSAFWDHTVAGPLLSHSAVCEGIAKMFLFLCQRLDLPCAIIGGKLDGVPHAWNMIELNAERKYIDVTNNLQMLSHCLHPAALFKDEQTIRGNGYVW